MNPLKSASLEDVAADWLMRTDRGLTAAEERQLAAWLAEDPRHQTVFLALEETWHGLGAATPVAVAAAAPVAAQRWRWPAGLAAAAAILLVSAFGWREWRANHASYTLAAQTEVGGLRELTLPDGSVLHLNTNTEVKIAYSGTERRVDLAQGEAHFAVAKNPARPFIVRAAGVQVRAVGTAFNVRLNAASVEVLVTEGRVRLGETVPLQPNLAPTESAAAAPPELGAGERAVVALATPETTAPAAPVVALVPEQEIRHALAWQEKRLDFDGTPLGIMIDEINRYSHDQLVIEDARLRAERFGGSVPAGDTETIVRMLVNNFDITAERRGNTTVLRPRGP